MKCVDSKDAIVRQVIAGKFGCGSDRKRRLTEAGYNYNEIQTLVNNVCIMRTKPSLLKRMLMKLRRLVCFWRWYSG